MNTGIDIRSRAGRAVILSTRRRRRVVLEALVWLAGLALVAGADPTAPPLIDVCLLKAAGITFCPGCGLGHAMGYLARGEWQLAIETHALAPLVAAVLIHRILTLFHIGLSKRSLSRDPNTSHVQSHQIPA